MRDIFTAMVLLFAIVATPLAAQETKLGEDGADSPVATLADVSWLVGQWEGSGIGGARAVESWLPPSGGTMVGTFVQESDEGTIRFTEHLYLMEEDGALVLRLKHFNADLTGWEEKDDMLAFRLVDIEPCAAFFRGLTLRCADPERPGEGLVVAVRMRSEGDEVRELVFRFKPKPDPRNNPDCSRYQTYSYRTCFGMALDGAQQEHLSLRSKIIETMTEQGRDWSAFEASEAAFETYRDANCSNLDDPEATLCKLRLTNQRIDALKEIWLQGLHL